MRGMKSKEIEQVGDWPSYDKDLGLDGAKLALGIRKKILLGMFDAMDSREEEMIRDFKASKLSVDKFLKTYKR